MTGSEAQLLKFPVGDLLRTIFPREGGGGEPITFLGIYGLYMGVPPPPPPPPTASFLHMPYSKKRWFLE